MTEFDKPIPCPECGKPLTTVQVEKILVLEWQEAEHDNIEFGKSLPDLPEEEGYEENGQGGVVIRCYKCGKIIGESNTNQSWGIYPKSEDY